MKVFIIEIESRLNSSANGRLSCSKNLKEKKMLAVPNALVFVITKHQPLMCVPLNMCRDLTHFIPALRSSNTTNFSRKFLMLSWHTSALRLFYWCLVYIVIQICRKFEEKIVKKSGNVTKTFVFEDGRKMLLLFSLFDKKKLVYTWNFRRRKIRWCPVPGKDGLKTIICHRWHKA